MTPAAAPASGPASRGRNRPRVDAGSIPAGAGPRTTLETVPPPTSAIPAAAAPIALTVHQHSRVLEIVFDDGASFRIPFELMRVYSPSAEVQGHGPGQEVLQTGKRDVVVDDLAAVGHYAVQPRFSDGHDTGIFSWSYLYHLGRDAGELWQRYEARLAAAGAERDAPMHKAATGGACSSH